ncbi:MAG TPA: hypothetical protein VGP82_06460 [Ktedonobacterales bacterium]|nr:hypothetical protein [Ktedonobacterales bacterium]
MTRLSVGQALALVAAVGLPTLRNRARQQSGTSASLAELTAPLTPATEGSTRRNDEVFLFYYSSVPDVDSRTPRARECANEGAGHERRAQASR